MGVGRAPQMSINNFGLQSYPHITEGINSSPGLFLDSPFTSAHSGGGCSRSWAVYVSEISETWKVLSSKTKETNKWVSLARPRYVWQLGPCKDSVFSMSVVNPALGQALDWVSGAAITQSSLCALSSLQTSGRDRSLSNSKPSNSRQRALGTQRMVANLAWVEGGWERSWIALPAYTQSHIFQS